MLTQKLRDLAFLQLELRQQQAKKGLVRERLKRSFGNNKAKSSPLTDDPDTQQAPAIPGALDDMAIVEEVGDELAGNPGSDSSDDEDSELADLNKDAGDLSSKGFASLMDSYGGKEDEETDNLHGTFVTQESDRPTMPRTVRVFFGQKRHIPIEKVFHWDVEDGWEAFWFEGIRNCKQEMEFYELASSVEGRRERGTSDKQSFDGKGASSPIVIN